MANPARDATDKLLEQMERRLTGIYSRANKEIGESWKEYMAQAGESIKPFQEAYEAAKRSGDKEAIKEAGKALGQKQREVTLMDKHYKNMTEQLAQELSNVNKTAAAYVNNQLPKIYALNYNDTANGIAHTVKGVSFELVDANTVKNLATKDETLLPYRKIDGKKDVRWNTKKVNSEVLQGIIQGESIPKMARRLSSVTAMNQASAIRNARTATTCAENRGRMDMLHEAEDKGVIMHKVWLATGDDRTRDWHEDLNGDEREIDEPFENTIVTKNGSYRDKIMYPGDPDADPANTYNCRCTLTYKVVEFRGR